MLRLYNADLALPRTEFIPPLKHVGITCLKSVLWVGVFLPKLGVGASLFRLIEKVAKQISDERGAF